MSQSKQVLVSGSIAFDTILSFPGSFGEHILPDKIHILNVSFVAEGMTRHFGGTGGNIAYNLALLGMRPLLFGTAGRDFGPYREWLARNGVDLEGVCQLDDEYTAAATIITDRNDNQITAFHGGAMLRNDIPARSLLDPERVGMGIISPDGKAGMILRAEEFRRAEIPFVFDPGQSIPLHSGEELRGMINGSRALVVNDYELQMILDKTGLQEEELLALTTTVVVTLGQQGSRILDRDAGAIRIGIVPTRDLVDPTGAGDAYRAGLLLGLTREQPLEVCARLGANSAVFAVERHGTQTHHFSPADYRARFEETFGAWPLG